MKYHSQTANLPCIDGLRLRRNRFLRTLINDLEKVGHDQE